MIIILYSKWYKRLARIMSYSHVCSLRGEMSDGAGAVCLLEEHRVALQVKLEEDITFLQCLLYHAT